MARKLAITAEEMVVINKMRDMGVAISRAITLAVFAGTRETADGSVAAMHHAQKAAMEAVDKIIDFVMEG